MGIKLNKLSPDVVNQIAAGEVIERPSSVVKELIDNAIDAESTKITIKIKEGGIDLIEVSDNGTGIPKENMSSIFEAHTTSKIKNIEDLNTLLSMGFRGEALSTITSVAKVTLDSKYKEENQGNRITYDEKGQSQVEPTPKEVGTTIVVKDLFYNIPARRKYLKSASTEYRKISDLIDSYLLMYPNIGFAFIKDGKPSFDLNPTDEKGIITKKRIDAVLGKGFTENMLPVFYDGAGMKIQGYIGHPSTHKGRCTQQYIFVNNRAIKDWGISRAVLDGYARYLPQGEKIPFVISISIRPDLVDVNVHPRKEEIRFENPFRVHAAVEDAVSHTLNTELAFNPDSLGYKGLEETKTKPLQETKKQQIELGIKDNTTYTPRPSSSYTQTSTNFSALRDKFNTSSNGGGQDFKNKGYSSEKIINTPSVRDSLTFSKELLETTAPTPITQQSNTDYFDNSLARSIFQIFNKYIIVEFASGTLLVIDQHAAAERINFERLQKRESNQSNLQNLLIPVEMTFAKDEMRFLEENLDFFKDLGFIFDLIEDNLLLKSVPAEYTDTDYKQTFIDIFSLEDDLQELSKKLEEKKNDILATIACHASIRSGQKLDLTEMKEIFNELKSCNNAYSCPHGRPIIWKLSLTEIDKHFERTY